MVVIMRLKLQGGWLVVGGWLLQGAIRESCC